MQTRPPHRRCTTENGRSRFGCRLSSTVVDGTGERISKVLETTLNPLGFFHYLASAHRLLILERMPSSSRYIRALIPPTLVISAGLAVTGCDDTTTKNVDGVIDADGYALFAVDNDRQQRDDVTVTVREADPGATYVLLYSPTAPRDVGWFQFDPSTKSRCGGDTGPHCEVPSFGYMVDFAKVPEGAAEITLRDERCGCDADNKGSSWTGHWAVMRVERTQRTNKITFDVKTVKVSSFATEPNVKQLQ